MGDDDGDGMYGDEMEVSSSFYMIWCLDPVIVPALPNIIIRINLLQYGDDDYDMGDDDYDDYSKELNQYRKSKDRGRGESKAVHHPVEYAA